MAMWPPPLRFGRCCVATPQLCWVLAIVLNWWGLCSHPFEQMGLAVQPLLIGEGWPRCHLFDQWGWPHGHPLCYAVATPLNWWGVAVWPARSPIWTVVLSLFFLNFFFWGQFGNLDAYARRVLTVFFCLNLKWRLILTRGNSKFCSSS